MFALDHIHTTLFSPPGLARAWTHSGNAPDILLQFEARLPKQILKRSTENGSNKV